MNDEFLVMHGGAMKSLSDSGKVGGFLILFGQDNMDLDGEYFSRRCDFTLEGRTTLPLLYDHGRSEVFKRKKLTHVAFETHDAGIWIEGKLPIRENQRVEELWESVKRDELGLSSGTSEHLMERVRRGRVNEIVNWPISEASLAPRPAQPRSRAVALKSLPTAEFEMSRRRDGLSPEQRVREARVELIRAQHEQRMRDFERSQHADSREEEYSYYDAMAQVEIAKCELRRRQLALGMIFRR
jgi:phage head maturation protease